MPSLALVFGSAVLPDQRPEMEVEGKASGRGYEDDMPNAAYERSVVNKTKLAPQEQRAKKKPWRLNDLIAGVVKTYGPNIQEIWVTEVREGAKIVNLATGPVYVHFSCPGTYVALPGAKSKNPTLAPVWPPPIEQLMQDAKKPGLLAQLPPEILYKIASYLDDVGFVCLRNTCMHSRDSLAIESTVQLKPVQRYLLRGLCGLSGVMKPTGFFCATCTKRSLMSYGDKRPTIAALRLWRNENVHRGRRMRVVRCACEDWCEVGSLAVGTKEQKQKEAEASVWIRRPEDNLSLEGSLFFHGGNEDMGSKSTQLA